MANGASEADQLDCERISPAQVCGSSPSIVAFETDVFMTPPQSKRDSREFEFALSPIEARLERIEMGSSPIRDVKDSDSSPMKQTLVDTLSSPVKQVLVEAPSSPFRIPFVETPSSPIQFFNPEKSSSPMKLPCFEAYSSPIKQCQVEAFSSPIKQIQIEAFTSPIKRLMVEANSSPVKRVFIEAPSSPIRQVSIETPSSPIKVISISVGHSPSPAAREAEAIHYQTATALAEMKDYCSELTSQVAKHSSYSKNLEAKVEDLLKSNADLKCSNSKSIETLEGRLKSSKNLVEELQSHTNYLEGELETLSQAHDYAQTQSAELHKTYRELLEQNATLTETLQIAEAKQQKEASVVERLIEAKQNLETALKQEVTKTSRLVETLNESEGLREGLMARLDEAITREKMATAALKESLSENDRLVDELEDNTHTFDLCRETEIQSLKDKLGGAKAEVIDLTEKLNHRERELGRMRNKLNQAQIEANEISKKLAESHESLRAEREKSLQTAIQRQEQHATLKTLQEEIERSRVQLTQAAIDTEQLRILEGSEAKLIKQLGETKQTLIATSTELEISRGEKGQLSETNSQLERELNSQSEKLQQLSKQHEKVVKQFKAANEDLTTTQRSHEQTQQLATNLAAINDELHSEIVRLKDEASKTSLSIASTTKESAASTNALKEELESAREEIKNLHEENKRKLDILQQTYKNIANTRTEIDMLKKCIEQGQTTISDLKINLQSKTQEVNSLQAQLADPAQTETELEYLKYLLQLRDKEINELKEKGHLYYTQADEAIEFQRNEIDSLNKRLGSLLNENASQKEELKTALSDRDILLNEIKRLNSAGRIEDVRNLLGQMRDIRSRHHDGDSSIQKSRSNSKEEASYLKAQNQHLAEELKRRIYQVDTLHKHLQHAKRTRDGVDDLQARKQIVKQYDKIKGLKEGLTRIAD